jgi:ATP-dependent Clp protease adaptor protein ClpS
MDQPAASNPERAVNGQAGQPVVVPTRSSDHATSWDFWAVVVWNDPVNLMSYVVYVFRKVFGYGEEEATRLMLRIHHEGRAAVATGPRERVELDCHRLHRHGLHATLERV